MTDQNGQGSALIADALTETEARSICAWQYPAPYDVYSYPDWEIVERQGWDIAIPEKRSAEYIGFRTASGLVAFGRLTLLQKYVLIGIGLRPDSCGRGLGVTVMKSLIAEAQKRHPGQLPALEVRTFNVRAIRCYEKCGFRRVKQYVRNTLTGEDRFYFMVYQPGFSI